MTPKTSLTYLTHLSAALLPIALLWTLYHTATQAWWLADDPALLRSIAEYGIFPHFYQGEVWRNSVSYANLTPWVIFSLGIDWHLFGLEPFGYYIHHLLSFSVVLLIAYWVLNLFFSPLTCSLVLCIFVTSVPSANVAQLLMVRHYLEGLGFSLLAVGSYVKALQTQRTGWTLLGTCSYLLATTAKEIYVPLVLVLPSLPIGTWKQRWQKLIPFVIVAGAYVLWRSYMLKPSQLVSGYGEVVIPKLTWDTVWTLPTQLIQSLGWQHVWQWMILGLVAIIGLWVMFKQRLVGKILLWIMVTLLPIIPVLALLDSRYLFLPFFVSCLGVAIVLQFFIKKRWQPVAWVLGFLVFIVSWKAAQIGGPALIRQEGLLRQVQTEGKLILTDKQAHGVLVHPGAAFWYFSSLRWLREHILNLPVGVAACYDLCMCQPQPSDKVYQYVQNHLISSSAAEQLKECGKGDAELDIRLRFELGTLSWQLGPYQDGQYYGTASAADAVMDEQFYKIARQGHFYKGQFDKIYVVIKYISPAGWYTYSPKLMLDSTKKDSQGVVELNWQRPSKQLNGKNVE